MTAFASLPLNVRLATIFIVGALGGALANFAIYRFAWNKRLIGPWGKQHDDASPQTIVDFVPIAGWYFMRRDAGTHGRFFWLRPMCIEFFLGIGLAALYLFEANVQGLWPVPVRGLVPTTTTHSIFVAHAVLMVLLTAAMFIDFDEFTIPDEITVPGTILGLLISLVFPATLLPDAGVAPLLANRPWPAWFDGPQGLALGLGIVFCWTFAIIGWTWTTRYGIRRAFRYACVSFVRRNWNYLPLGIAATGSIITVIGWSIGGVYWQSVLSSLIGLAFAGGLVWLVRIAANISIRIEAMGFGDVTLMFMVGTFIGWQPGLVVFALAPFAGALLTVIYAIVKRSASVPFGPYLCLGTVMAIVLWDSLWLNAKLQFFDLLGIWVLPFVLGGVIVLAVLLWPLHQLRVRFFDLEDEVP